MVGITKESGSIFSSIRFRLSVLLLLGLLVLVGYFMVVNSVDHQQEDSLYHSRLDSRIAIFNSFVNNSSDTLHTFAFDYTYWDDMVNFVKGGGKDTEFAQGNIDPGLSTFKASAIWVYNPQQELVYSVSGLDEASSFDPAVTQPIKPGEFGRLFKANGVFQYFVKTDNGFFEVYAATIHPTNDPDRKTPAQGYFFVGKAIDKSYLKQAGDSVEGQAFLIDDASKIDSLDTEFREQTGQIAFVHKLKDFNGEVDGALYVKYVAADLRDALKVQDRITLFGVILMSGMTLMLFLVLVAWVILPLRKVQSALSLDSDQPVAKLKRHRDEFGNIARLIERFLLQKRELQDEKERVEQKVIERTGELQNEQRMLSTLLQNLPVGVHVVRSPSGETILMNAEGVRLVGRAEVPGTTKDNYGEVYDIIKLDGQPYPEAELPMTITLREGKTVMKDDIFVRKPDGTIIQLKAITTPIRSVDGTVRTAVGVFEDVSKERQLDRSREEFFSIASHELRTPLTAIRGNTSLIQQHYGEELKDPDLKEMISDIHESSIRLIEIVNDFLDTSRLEQKRLKFNPEPFDAVKLAETVIRQFQVTSSRRNIALEVRKPEHDLPLVHADPDRARQVLINLVGNALKFTEQGSITISFRRTDGHIKVLVSDTGKGISAEGQKLLFKKFEQTSSNILTRDSVQGTGLGLYISKMIIEQMGGRIELESSEIGKGTTFSFTLPIASDASRSRDQQEHER